MSSEKSFFQRYFLILLIVVMGITYLAQLRYDVWMYFGSPKIKVSYNEYIEPQPLSPAMARASSFGANEFMADYYWLQFIQYYGGGDPYGKYRKLAEIFNTITDLSPKFSQAYQTGLLVLPAEGFIDQAIALGEKGQKNLADDWEMPYYTGLVYHIYKKDYVKAAEKFAQAAALPDAPPITKLFVGIYYNKANDRDTAYAIFQVVYETSKDSYVKERASKYVGHLEGVFRLEDAVKTFHDRYGRYPNNLDELVTKKIIDKLPVSPLSINYTLDPATGAIGEGK
jgi:hypothetical protein